MIDGKRGGEWCTALHPERTTAARHGGRDIGKGARLRTVGDIGGGERDRSRREREEGTTWRKGSAWRSGMGAAPRACVYI